MSTRERLDISEVVGDLEIPCDVVRRHGVDRPAADYIAWVQACCPERKDVGFMCCACLDFALTSPDPCWCPTCGHRWPRVGLWIRRYEPIG